MQNDSKFIYDPQKTTTLEMRPFHQRRRKNVSKDLVEYRRAKCWRVGEAERNSELKKQKTNFIQLK